MVMGADRSDPQLEIKGICRSSQFSLGLSPLCSGAALLLNFGWLRQNLLQNEEHVRNCLCANSGALMQGTLILPRRRATH